MLGWVLKKKMIGNLISQYSKPLNSKVGERAWLCFRSDSKVSLSAKEIISNTIYWALIKCRVLWIRGYYDVHSSEAAGLNGLSSHPRSHSGEVAEPGFKHRSVWFQSPEFSLPSQIKIELLTFSNNWFFIRIVVTGCYSCY